MVTPDRRRVAVERLQARFGVSQRRACRVVGQHRSTQRRPKAPPMGPNSASGSICGTSLAAIPAWGGARPMWWLTARGWSPIPSAHGGSGVMKAYNGHRSARAKRRRLTDGTAARL